MYRYGREIRARLVGSARLHSRTMNKIVGVRPAYGAAVQGSAGLPTGQRGKRKLQMHRALPTSLAYMGLSSAIAKGVFQHPARSTTPSSGPGAPDRVRCQGKPRENRMIRPEGRSNLPLAADEVVKNHDVDGRYRQRKASRPRRESTPPLRCAGSGPPTRRFAFSALKPYSPLRPPRL